MRVLVMAAVGVGTQLVTAAMFVWAARSIGAEELGLAVVVLGVGAAISGLLDFGANSTLVRDLAAKGVDPIVYGRHVRGKVTYCLIGLVTAVTLSLHGETNFLWMIATVATGQVLMQALLVPLRAGAAAGRMAAIAFIEKTLPLGALAGLLSWTETAVALVVSVAAGTMFASVATYVVTDRTVRAGCFGPIDLLIWRRSSGFGFFGLANSAQNLDTSVLAITGGSAAAGVYGAISRWTQPLGIPVNAFTTIAMPVMAREQTASAALRAVRGTLWIPGLSIVGAIIVATSSPWLVGLLLGAEFADSAVVLSALAVSVAPAIACQPFAALMQARGHESALAGAFITSVIVQLSLIAGLAPELGPLAAAVALGVSQLGLLIFLIARFRKLLAQET